MMCGALLLLPVLARAGSFTLYSEPIRLRPGEVHNAFSKPIPVPANIREQFKAKAMPLNSFSMDIVETDSKTGAERSVPLYEMYNHHYIVHAGSFHEMDILRQSAPKPGCHAHTMRNAGASFGGGTGAEFRGYPFELPAPYAQMSPGIEYVMPLLHVINVRQNTSLLECPCAPGRVDAQKGTIDGKPLGKMQFNCNEEFIKEANPTCSLSTYTGGLRCCENGVFLPEHPDLRGPYSEIRMKMSFGFRDEADEAKRPSINVDKTHCCDVTGSMYHNGSFHGAGGGGNIEYDIPKCASGVSPAKCIHTASTVQTIDYIPGVGDDPDELLELVQATGHLHKAALSLDLIDERSGDVVCRVSPLYGSSNQAGDEKGFLVGLKPCKFGFPPLSPPPRFRRSDLVRSVAKYNSTEAHTGVMSLWLLKVVRVNTSAIIV